jgi:hypothetical protein
MLLTFSLLMFHYICSLELHTSFLHLQAMNTETDQGGVGCLERNAKKSFPTF